MFGRETSIVVVRDSKVGEQHMYNAEISRTNPTAYLFIVDQSASMNDKMTNGESKASFVADVVNKTLRDLVIRCTREDGVRNYFDVGIITYSNREVANGLPASLSGKWLAPISAVADNTTRVEDRTRQVDDGSGNLVEQVYKFPVWLDARGYGGTPMQAAVAQAAHVIADWSDSHPSSFPATVLHITDGESNDGNPENNAEVLRSLTTNDGATLLYNIHVTDENVEPLRFPRTDDNLPDPYAEMIFRMSSTFPQHVRDYARDAYGITLESDARAMVLNAEADDLVKFVDIGSRPAGMR